MVTVQDLFFLCPGFLGLSRYSCASIWNFNNYFSVCGKKDTEILIKKTKICPCRINDIDIIVWL